MSDLLHKSHRQTAVRCFLYCFQALMCVTCHNRLYLPFACLEGAAKVGVTETTFEPQAFSVRGASNCFIWDLPGANTPNNPAETYFKDKLLCAFDGLLLVSGDTFLESDLEVLKQAQHYGIPVALVRTKSDMHIYNMVYSEAIEPEAAERYWSLLN